MTCLAPNSQSIAHTSVGKTVLLAEPDFAVREAVTSALESEGYRVVQVVDGGNALERLTSSAASEAINLLILEVTLPRISGLDLCKLLRQRGHNLPILMISSKASETDRVVGLELGADDYLVKPFGLRELIARCRALLRQWSQSALAQPAVLRYRDLTLDPVSCTVARQSQPVALTPKEFRLLEIFMRSPQRVWTREQLIDRIWSTDFIGDLKTVDVHIRWLREKVEPNPGQPQYIKTVRGFGYRFG